MTSSITLRSCPKKYILDTHRSRVPEDTLKFVEQMKTALGMDDFRDVTDIDRIGLPVFTCSRIRPDQSRTYHTGKGLSKVQAQVSLTMESIERYSSEFREKDTERLIKGNYRELSLSHNVLHPQKLILPRFSDFREDIAYHWATGYDLTTRKTILVPACSVYHPFHLDEPELMATHTNGIAAGNSLEEAVFHGLMEVIERDAWSIIKFGNLETDSLFIAPDGENEFLLHIENKLRAANVDITLLDYTLDLGIPIVAAKGKDLVIENLMLMEGFGAHLDPKVAAARAMMELATTRGLLFQKHGAKNLIEARNPYFEERFPDNSDIEERTHKNLQKLDIGYSQDILTDIQWVGERLLENGLAQIIVVDLTRDEIQIPTARVIVPGMEAFGFDPSRVGERLYQFL